MLLLSTKARKQALYKLCVPYYCQTCEQLDTTLYWFTELVYSNGCSAPLVKALYAFDQFVEKHLYFCDDIVNACPLNQDDIVYLEGESLIPDAWCWHVPEEESDEEERQLHCLERIALL